MYDGFISYSHAADGLLAPRLQAGLQRFAKPWWKRRALRIFRDEASLSANPHLWSSITEALDESEWFLLLLSPDAAASEWVDREVAWWLEHKDADRIIPVLTEGEFSWDGGIVSDAAPPALFDVFDDEPRWVDLRFARSEEQLDLKNPVFADAVADLAAPLRGIPKDELASEEVRQHRRTIRTAWAAGMALLALSVFSVAIAVFALDQQAKAERQTEIAQQSEAEAQRQQVRAEESEALAIQREETIRRQTAEKEASRLTVASGVVLEEDPELASLLALQALTVAPEELKPEIRLALRDSLRENRLLDRFEIAPAGIDYGHLAVVSPDGNTIFHWSGPEDVLRAIDVESHDVLWVEPVSGTVRSLAIDPSGTLLAVSVNGTTSAPPRTMLFDVESPAPETLDPLLYEGCEEVWRHEGGFSPDGGSFSVLVRDCDAAGGATGDLTVVYDTTTWTEAFTFETPDLTFEKVRLSADASRMLRVVFDEETSFSSAQVVSHPELEVVAEVDRTLFAALSPDGGQLAYTRSLRSVELRDVDSGESVGVFDLEGGEPACCDPIRFSPDGNWISVIVEGTRDFVFDARDGSLEFRSYLGGDTYDHSWTRHGTKLLTVHPDALLLWALTPDPARVAAVDNSRDWVSLAFEIVARGFSTGECLTYGLDPCSTLDNLREALFDSG